MVRLLVIPLTAIASVPYLNGHRLSVVAAVSFLPLIVFVGTFVAETGMLRWDGKAGKLAGRQRP